MTIITTGRTTDNKEISREEIYLIVTEELHNIGFSPKRKDNEQISGRKGRVPRKNYLSALDKISDRFQIPEIPGNINTRRDLVDYVEDVSECPEAYNLASETYNSNPLPPNFTRQHLSKQEIPAKK